MRVGIGTVLSVLSFSVLAAVIPNYDYHDPLLVRRAVNLENKDVLWKRANDEQTGLDSLNSGSGAKTETSTSTSNGGSDNQQALLKEMVGIQNDGKKIVKKHLKDVTSGINGITKSPDYVMRELVEITKSISGMLTAFEVIYRHDYMPLVSKVKGANNEEHIKATDTYMSEMVKYRIDILDAFDSINDKIKDGGLTFKIKIPSRFSIFKSRVKERLGFQE
ncbi:hypothetical protein BASA83_001144 [Batrachochytrium salamandrivorans]|nr:hypothetical protein BASA83_001144 [Batrachochytrium salamandrivorans]